MAVKEVQPAGDNGQVRITGYASTSDVDRYRDIVKPEAFKSALETYNRNPVLLRSHNPDRPIGTVESAVIDGKGLKITAVVMDEQTAKEVSDGRMRALSIGYIPLESSLEHEDGSPFNAEKDSVWDSDLIRVINKLDLVEISIVAVPANGNALFTLEKSVKKYFNAVATKAFGMSKKDAVDAPENEVDPDKAEPAAEPAEPQKPAAGEPDESAQGAEADKPAQEEPAAPTAPNEEVKPEEEKNAEPEKVVEADASEDAANDTQQPNTATQDGENAVEITAPAGTEPSGNADEEPAEPKVEPESQEGKAFSISAKTAALFPELVQSGAAVQDEKAAEIPTEFAEFARKLLSMTISQEAEIKTLREKLDKTPTKSALSVTGQFDGKPQESGASKDKKDTPFLNMLFNTVK